MSLIQTEQSTIVSNPYRYSTNPFSTFPNQCSTLRFQTLIGILQTPIVQIVLFWSFEFQTLIGILQTIETASTIQANTEFQTLIGILQTSIFLSTSLNILKFQTLIGILQTRYIA